MECRKRTTIQQKLKLSTDKGAGEKIRCVAS
jgi:hypothetical protein